MYLVFLFIPTTARLDLVLTRSRLTATPLLFVVSSDTDHIVDVLVGSELNLIVNTARQ